MKLHATTYPFTAFTDLVQAELKVRMVRSSHGTMEGVRYHVAMTMGGALHLLVDHSNFVGHFTRRDDGLCVGTAPTKREEGFAGFAVPPNWLHIEPEDPPRNFADQFNQEFE